MMPQVTAYLNVLTGSGFGIAWNEGSLTRAVMLEFPELTKEVARAMVRKYLEGKVNDG